jgi:hypothetical protein
MEHSMPLLGDYALEHAFFEGVFAAAFTHLLLHSPGALGAGVPRSSIAFKGWGE